MVGKREEGKEDLCDYMKEHKTHKKTIKYDNDKIKSKKRMARLIRKEEWRDRVIGTEIHQIK